MQFCFVFAVRSQSLGISVFLEHLYYTDDASRVIKRVNKYTGGKPLDVNVKRMGKPPTDIKVVHALNQPLADSPSSFPGCSSTVTIELLFSLTPEFITYFDMINWNNNVVVMNLFYVKQIVTNRVETVWACAPILLNRGLVSAARVLLSVLTALIVKVGTFVIDWESKIAVECLNWAKLIFSVMYIPKVCIIL